MESFFIFLACVFFDSGKQYSAPAIVTQALLYAAKLNSFMDTSCLDVFKGEDPKTFFKEYSIKVEYRVQQITAPPTPTAKYHADIVIFGNKVAECSGESAQDVRYKCDETIPKITTIQEYGRDVVAFNASQLTRMARVEERRRPGYEHKALTLHFLDCTEEELNNSFVRVTLPLVEKQSPRSGIPMKITPILSMLVWKNQVISGAVHRHATVADEWAMKRYCAAKTQNRDVNDLIFLDPVMFGTAVLNNMYNYYPAVPYDREVFDMYEKTKLEIHNLKLNADNTS